jgi:putative hydrolase of the HAD superfamily
MNADPSRPQLVFDVGGVLAGNLDGFWSDLARQGGIDRTELRLRYKEEVGSRLWQGSLSEAQFWDWLRAACPGVGTEDARDLLRRALVPLPALDHLEDWSRRADLHILSNHVAAWIMPLFADLGTRIASFTVSSEEGFHKPDIRLFRAAEAKLNAAGSICFVDDKADNLETARRLGWETILADEGGRWIEEIDRRLR